MLVVRGMTGPEVGQVQRALNAHIAARSLMGVAPLAVDNNFGALTEQAVKQFQIQKGLLMTGGVDDATWAVLGGGAAPTTPTPQPAALPPTYVTAGSVVECAMQYAASGFVTYDTTNAQLRSAIENANILYDVAVNGHRVTNIGGVKFAAIIQGKSPVDRNSITDIRGNIVGIARQLGFTPFEAQTSIRFLSRAPAGQTPQPGQAPGTRPDGGPSVTTYIILALLGVLFVEVLTD